MEKKVLFKKTHWGENQYGFVFSSITHRLNVDTITSYRIVLQGEGGESRIQTYPSRSIFRSSRHRFPYVKRKNPLGNNRVSESGDM